MYTVQWVNNRSKSTQGSAMEIFWPRLPVCSTKCPTIVSSATVTTTSRTEVVSYRTSSPSPWSSNRRSPNIMSKTKIPARFRSQPTWKDTIPTTVYLPQSHFKIAKLKPFIWTTIPAEALITQMDTYKTCISRSSHCCLKKPNSIGILITHSYMVKEILSFKVRDLICRRDILCRWVLANKTTTWFLPYKTSYNNSLTWSPQTQHSKPLASALIITPILTVIRRQCIYS